MTILERIASDPSLLRIEEGRGTYIVSAIPGKGDFLEEEALDAVNDILSILHQGAGTVVRAMARNCCDESGDRLCDCIDAIEFTPDLSFSCRA